MEYAINPLTSHNDKINSNHAFRSDTDISKGGYTNIKKDDLVFADSTWTTPATSSSLESSSGILDGGLLDNTISSSTAGAANNNTAAGRKGIFGTTFQKKSATTPLTITP